MINKRRGISLIVLIITVVIIVILATAVIVNLVQTNVIDKTKEAVVQQDFKTFQDELNLYLADKYAETLGKFEYTSLNLTKKSQIQKVIPSLRKSIYDDYVVIESGKIAVTKEMPEPQRTWAMKALGINKMANESVEEEKINYITTGLQCYLDATEESSFVGSVWNDLSGNSNSAILNGCTYSDNKVVFDGVDDWANIGELTYPNYTFEVIFDTNDLKTSMILGNWQNGGAGIIYNGSILKGQSYVNGAYDDLLFNIAADTKYKVTYTTNGNECKLYVNGELIQTSNPNGYIEMADLKTIMAIGANPAKDTIDYKNFFNGNIYLVRIYDRVLSEDEIKQNYNYDNEKIAINDTVYENINVVDNLYEIKSLTELEEFRNQVNNGNSFEGKYVELKTNLDLSSITSWTPIGTETNPFKGIFNGNEHKISNLNIDNSTNYQGLFGNNAGIVENVIIESGTIKGTYRVGGIVGYNTGIISNCINKAKIDGTEYHVGGICGYSSGTIQKCYNYGECSNTYSSLGGIVGRNNGDIKFCGNNGTVTGKTIAAYATGGIAGTFGGNGKISSCYNKANIIAEGINTNGTSNCGGIVGNVYDENNNLKMKIHYCYNTGNVTSYGSNAGGIAAHVGSTVNAFELMYCYNTGEIISQNAPTNNAGTYAGGIVGNSTSTVAVYKYCYNIGNIQCLAGTKHPGGIAGYDKSSISYCYTLSTLGLNVCSNSKTSTNTSGLNGKLTEANMKTDDFITKLGGTSKWYLDGGYPKLMWE